LLNNRLPEFNIFSLAFLPLLEDEYALAIVHMDHQQRIQLLARDIEVDEGQLSTFPSTQLHATIISANLFPFPADHPPRLVTIYPPGTNGTEDDDDDQLIDSADFLGGVLVVGGKNIILYELVDRDGQEKQKGKRKRLEDRKKSSNPVEKERAREKEAEREGKKRKPRANVAWPWSNVAA
jgi:DNA damage-binding protein 1